MLSLGLSAARAAQAGVSLIEMMIALAIVAFLLFVGVPQFATFLQNTQIRNAAETALAGIQLAKAEAVRRNAPVRFQLVSDLSSGCTVATSAVSNSTAASWVVSLDDPAGACDAAPSDAAAPRIVQKKSAAEGSANVRVTTDAAPTLIFNGLGRPVPGGFQRLEFKNVSGKCEHEDSDGTMRCLDIMVSAGGSVKLCDPKVTDATDPRHCS